MMPSSTELSISATTTTATTVAVPGRGRGRVVPRKAAAGTAIAPPPSAVVPSAGFPRPPDDAAAERALLLGQAPWRARRSLRSGGGGSVPLYSSVADAATGALRRGEPAVLTGARLSTLRLGAAAAAGASSSSSSSTPGVTILTSAPGVDRFFEIDPHKNADPRAYYHVARPETSSTAAVGGGGDGSNANANLSEWLRRASSWTETRTLCRALLGAWESSSADQATISFRPNAPALREASRGGLLRPSASSSSASAASALSPSDLLDWPRALELLRAMAAPAGGGELWLEACNPSSSASSSSSSSSAALLLPMRAVPFARVIVQVSGHRRVVLVDPVHTFGDDGLNDVGMRPFPFAHPLEGYSSRGWEEGDEGDEENEDDGGGGKPSCPIRGRVAELVPGDVLVIPAHWWAHQELLMPPTRNQASNNSLLLHAALELRLSPAAPLPLSPGALRAQAARLAEGVLAASLGAPAVARCLEALARGDGQQQQGGPLPRTVRAYDRAVAAAEAFEMLVAACLAAPRAGTAAATKGPVGRLLRAEAEARALCAAMLAGGRLSGGGMGSVGSAVGGLEGVTTQRWLIEEDAEAARFPTLFRHRLLGAREDWRRHAVPLLMLPGAAGGALPAAGAASALPPPAAS